MSTLRGALTLSPKQKQILAQVLAGRTNREIAAELRITEQSVKNQLSDAYKYFGVWHVRQLFSLMDRVREEIQLS